MDNTDAPGGSSDFQQQLLALRKDPQVRRLAQIWTGDPDLAEDALQTACGGLIALRHPECIENLRAYYLRVLRNEAAKLYAVRRETPLENPEDALDPGQSGIAFCGQAPTPLTDETVCHSLQAQTWFERLADQYDCLLAAIPARSDDPPRYRALIYAAAEQVLCDGLNGKPGDADSNNAFRAAYPAYFAQPGASANLSHQRFRRAREDVKALLREVVRRDEL